MAANAVSTRKEIRGVAGGTRKRRKAAIAAALVVALLAASSPAQAYWGRFDPCTGGDTVTVDVIDSNAAHWVCIAEAARHGAYASAAGLLALTALGVFAAACTVSDPYRPGEGMLIAPISPGLGQLLGAAASLATPDAILGHEARHLFDHAFHPPVASGLDLECEP